MFRVRSLALVCALMAGVAGAQTGQSPAEIKKEELRLKQLDNRYQTTKALYLKDPKNKKRQDDFVKAATIFGHETMVSPAVPANVKYKKTLRIYREVLKLDPNNPVAKPESELIISIYKQMGRPVPQ